MSGNNRGMWLCKRSCILFVALAIVVGCSACSQKKDDTPIFSGYEKVCELATLECKVHNVAEVYNPGTDYLFGIINLGYKKAWFEYDGTVTLGVNASKVSITDPDENGLVTITIPDAEILGIPDIDESSFSDVYSDTATFAVVTIQDQTEALNVAQEGMSELIETNGELMERAKERVKTLLLQFVTSVEDARGETYTVEFVDAE